MAVIADIAETDGATAADEGPTDEFEAAADKDEALCTPDADC